MLLTVTLTRELTKDKPVDYCGHEWERKMENKQEELTFEAALQALEETVTKLEGGDLELDEALALFEKGQALAAQCSAQLESAALRVEMLTEDGEIIELSGQ
jgi:exodeoxyribonuclease VII small subunit